MKTGPRNLITDVDGIKVGNAHDAALKSGVTVLCADDPFTASVHVMGGAPGAKPGVPDVCSLKAWAS